ncbi:MAG: PilT/PilU family type 4a pilus ATPase [Candidatus Aureabacteria bacterium]|nr:PilT/PilU family type 4a pilus ATPase [Candidatus Auribacterota bacterium]
MAGIDSFLEEVVVKNASDLHLSSGRVPMMRLHGIMAPFRPEKLSSPQIMDWLNEIMTPFSRSLYENTFDVDFAYSTSKEKYRFRVNMFKDKEGPGVVFRHIPSKLPSFEDISLEEGARHLCDLNRGLVLVTGPTGSGKSTTIASMIHYINQTRPYHIITIEDPIEFIHDSNRCLIHQRELHTHTHSFQDALRASLRQDPNVILVGEMRDIVTTRLAIEAAETGHLVFGTLHTNTAYSTISRVINQFGEEEQELIRAMLSDNLKGVVCQTLLARTDEKGGRIAAREILLHTVAGSNLIRENKLHQVPSLLDSNQDIGMISLNASLSNLISQGCVSPEAAWYTTMDQKDLMNRFNRLGIHLEGAS